MAATQKWVFPMLVLMASFGTAGCFNLVYAVHAQIFDTLFAATAMGICNGTAKIATIFAPMVAEVKGTTSIWIYVSLACLSMIISQFISKNH